jgi:hypothetical protein
VAVSSLYTISISQKHMKNSGCAFVRIWLIVHIYLLREKSSLLGEKSSHTHIQLKKLFVVDLIGDLRCSVNAVRDSRVSMACDLGLPRFQYLSHLIWAHHAVKRVPLEVRKKY